jgi:hypothetical protein
MLTKYSKGADMTWKVCCLFIVNLFLTIFVLLGCSRENQKDIDASYNCIRNMKYIFDKGFFPYANDNDNKLPDNLYELFQKEYITDINKFLCPAVLTTTNLVITSKEHFDRNCDYIYLGKGGIVEEADYKTIILVDKYNNHKKTVGILFSNGACFSIKKKNLVNFCKKHHQNPYSIWAIEK